MTAKQLIKLLQAHPDEDIRLSNRRKGNSRNLNSVDVVEYDENWGFIIVANQ